ncbi:MAG: DUF4126 domain-containing protein [Actinomycetaceae bacterium]|nr:DUF4126 domain-containing protein [Actinomycetaceae bacterium]
MGYLTALGLSSAAGLNAYIPLLVFGLIARYTDIVTLPEGWAWISNGWTLSIVALLLIVEIVADKIPALDSINDIVQTFIRPTSGGLVFASGVSAQTPMVSAMTDHSTWKSLVVGAIIALIFHGFKALGRPAANVSTAGVGAPIISTIEDVFALAGTLVAIFLPVLVAVVIVAVLVILYLMYRKMKGRKRTRGSRVVQI